MSFPAFYLFKVICDKQKFLIIEASKDFSWHRGDIPFFDKYCLTDEKHCQFTRFLNFNRLDSCDRYFFRPKLYIGILKVFGLGIN